MCFLSLWRPLSADLRSPPGAPDLHPTSPALAISLGASRGWKCFPWPRVSWGWAAWEFHGISPRPKMTQAILRVASLIWVCQQVRNLAATCSHCFWSGKPVLKALWHPTFLNALTLLGSRGKTVSGAVQKCPWLSHRSRTNQSIWPSGSLWWSPWHDPPQIFAFTRGIWLGAYKQD